METLPPTLPAAPPTPPVVSIPIVPQESPLDSNPGPRKRKAPAIPEGLIVPPKANSFVWQYFRVKSDQADQKNAYCTLCYSWYSWGKSTTNLIYHLHAKHAIDPPEASKPQYPSVQDMLASSPLGEVKRSQITRSIGWMMAHDLHSFSLVRQQGFSRLLQILEPKYQMPERRYFSEKLIPQMYEEEKSKLLGILKEISAFALSCDLWTSIANDPFLTLTIHWVCLKTFVLHTRVLCTVLINGRHTGENIACIIREQLDLWNLSISKISAIVTDNASAMILAVQILGVPHFACFAHTLQLVIHDGKCW